MMIVLAPVEGYTGSVAGVVFVDGRAETDNENALAYFRRHGYRFGGGTVEPLKELNVVQIPDGEPTDKWKVTALRAYAEREGIDLEGATKKDEILAVVAGTTPSDDGDADGATGAAGDDTGD